MEGSMTTIPRHPWFSARTREPVRSVVNERGPSTFTVDCQGHEHE